MPIVINDCKYCGGAPCTDNTFGKFEIWCNCFPSTLVQMETEIQHYIEDESFYTAMENWNLLNPSVEAVIK